jgi:alpha/beta superfamily hydrolase
MGVIQNRSEISFLSDGLKLEGLLHLPEAASEAAPAPGVVVAHPHPQYGGDMYNSVVQAVCEAALSAGVAALRFNFRGVGFSDGAFDNGVGERRDVDAALNYLRGVPEVDAGRVGLCGYSFGAMVAVAYADKRTDLAALVSVANPTQRGPRLELRLPTPTLFITGDRDNYCDAELLQEYRTQIGDDVAVHVVPGVDHFWVGSEERLKEAVARFLGQHLLKMTGTQ